MTENVIPIYFSENSIFNFDFDIFQMVVLIKNANKLYVFPIGNKERLIPFAIDKVTSWGTVFFPRAGLKLVRSVPIHPN